MIFHSHKRKVASNINLKILDYEHNLFKYPECKNFDKNLGYCIDNNISWKNHDDYITLKMSKTVGIVSHLQHFLPTNILLSIYCSLIQLFISYGLSGWGKATKSNHGTILNLQKNVLHLIQFHNKKDHAISLVLVFQNSSS